MNRSAELLAEALNEMGLGGISGVKADELRSAQIMYQSVEYHTFIHITAVLLQRFLATRDYAGSDEDKQVGLLSGVIQTTLLTGIKAGRSIERQLRKEVQ